MTAVPEADREGPLTWRARLNVLTAWLQYLWPCRRWIGVSALAVLIASVLGVLPPYLTKMIIDSSLSGSSEGRFLERVSLLFAVPLLAAAFDIVRSAAGIRIGTYLMRRIRADMFDKLMRLPVEYYDRRPTAPFIGRIQHDVAQVESFLREAIPHFLAQAVLTFSVLGMLFALNGRAAAVVLGLLPLSALAIRSLWPRLRSRTLRAWNAEYGLQQSIAESLQGIRLIKAFRQEEAERDRFNRRNQAAVDRYAEQLKSAMWMQPGLRLAISWAIAFVWLAGGLQVIRGRLSLGTIVAFTSYLTLFLGQLRSTFHSAGWANRALASADRILDLLRTEAPITEPDASGEMGEMVRAKGDIRVQSVTFAYEAGRNVLHDVSFHVRPGETVGITGRSGSGKSTLIQLLCRLYDPDSGCVLLDGVDLRRIAPGTLGRQIGLIMQDVELFDGSIAENIAFGKPGASPREIVEAARIAGAHSFISRLPYGYDTRVGERGVRLSGGEKQRISIARAVLLDPPVLLLDEATSAMDAHTERAVQRALERLGEGRTVIAVSHRLSTLRNADRILVLENGRVAESGTHEQLAAARGFYYGLLEANRLAPEKEMTNGRHDLDRPRGHPVPSHG